MYVYIYIYIYMCVCVYLYCIVSLHSEARPQQLSLYSTYHLKTTRPQYKKQTTFLACRTSVNIKTPSSSNPMHCRNIRVGAGSLAKRVVTSFFANTLILNYPSTQIQSKQNNVKSTDASKCKVHKWIHTHTHARVYKHRYRQKVNKSKTNTRWVARWLTCCLKKGSSNEVRAKTYIHSMILNVSTHSLTHK